jgi:hypothetical protein
VRFDADSASVRCAEPGSSSCKALDPDTRDTIGRWMAQGAKND